MTAGERARVAGSLLVLVAIGAGALQLAAAMALYPGGTAFDPSAPGHSFWFNFLCDLTGDVAVNGRPNRQARPWALGAMMALSVALLAFWTILPSGFPTRRRLGHFVRTSGILSVGGLLVTPFSGGTSHVVAVFASSVPALLAGTFGLVGLGAGTAAAPSPPSPRPRGRGASIAVGTGTLVASLADSILYARSYLIHPRAISLALPLLQRVALLLMLAWMAIVAWQVLRTSTGNQVDRQTSRNAAG